MNRRTARLVFQAMVVAMLFWPVISDAFPIWAQLGYLAFAGVTVAELGVVFRFGKGSPWRSG